MTTPIPETVLPELPEPFEEMCEPPYGRYSATQMREYASTALRASEARVAELQAEARRLRDAGAPMANTLFNLAQRPGEVLTADWARLFDKMRRDWDDARAALKECGS